MDWEGDDSVFMISTYLLKVSTISKKAQSTDYNFTRNQTKVRPISFGQDTSNIAKDQKSL
jgi:hypothetical protein